MDDPRLVALGLVPAPPGQEKTQESSDPPASPPATPDWQPLQQSQYAPPTNPFSAAASTIPEYPDPFTSPPAAPPPAPAPSQPSVPSIFNSPNSPFSFAPPAEPAAPPSAPAAAPARAVAPFTPAPGPFTSPSSPFSTAPAPTSFTAAAPAVAPTTKGDRKEAKRAAEEAKKAAKLGEENAKHMAKVAAAQAKIDEREAKKLLKGGRPSAPAAPAPARFVPPVLSVAPQKTPAYVELMNAIGKHPGAIKKDVRFGLVGRARLELAPTGIALVGLRGGTAYTWSEVQDVQAQRGQLLIKTEAPREKVVKTKEGTTWEPYVEKMTRALVISIDGASEPGFAPHIARVMQDMKAQTFNYHATSWLEYENALERMKTEFAEHDDQFVPAVAGALFAFIFIAGLAILPEIINLATDIKPAAGAFVVQPRYLWFDLRSAVMAVGMSALLTRLVLRLGLGPAALSWARGTVRGWPTGGPRAVRFATRQLARLLLSTSIAAGAMLVGFATFTPTVASTLVIDSVGLREVVPLPFVGIDRQWAGVSDVQKSKGPGRLEGFGVTVFFGDGRWITTIDHDLSGGSDGQLLKAATSWWQNATR
jgi:hypothetical protein